MTTTDLTPVLQHFSGSVVDAEYRTSPIPGYQNNPLIEALPPILTAAETVARLRYEPDHDDGVRQLPTELRLHLLHDALRFFKPLPVHVELEQRLSRLIRAGYQGRNPLVRGFRRQMDVRLQRTVQAYQQTRSQGFTLLGMSGVGKTTAVEGILSLYPQIVVHQQYQEQPFSHLQVVWLKLDCPHDGSIRGLCLAFFQAMDGLLDTRYYRYHARNGRATTDEMLPAMARVSAIHSLGVLVLDEIQHLSEARSGGAARMLNFFVHLVNTIGMPVVLVGTPKAQAVASPAPRPLNLDRTPERHLLRLARAASWLLTHPETSAETFRLKERGLLQLVAQELATYSGRLKQREITEAVETIFSTEMLAQIGCAWTPQEETSCWVRRLLQNGSTTCVLYSLLLLLFFADDVPAFLALPAELKPFGEGPWPCLNPACEHDGERCIQVCEVDYNSKGFPRGTFTCAICGFVYSRIGPDTKPGDHYRIGEVKARGPIWEAKLRQLWVDPDVTIRHMTALLRSSWGHLRWQGTRLGLPFPPPGVRARRRTKTPAPQRTRGVSPDPTSHREQWLKVVQQNPEMGAKDLRWQDPQVYNWLRYHDREWLLNHTPEKQHNPRRPVVDWRQRDDELVAEIELGHQQLMSRQPPLFRVSTTAILTAIRRRGYYTRNRHRLPQSVDKLHQLAESYEDFAIRRVWHFANAFHAKGQAPRRRVIAECASVDGLPHRDNPRVQTAVDEALAWLRGE